MRSASYSRDREIAICTRAAASGDRIITAISAMGFWRARLLPKNMAKLASMEIAPAKVAVTVMMSVS